MKVLRILNLDGGGMKGLFSSHFMDYFCKTAGIDGKSLWEHFDIIGGTSIGAIMGGAYAYGKSPEDMIKFFTETGPNIFTYNDGTKGPISGGWKVAYTTLPSFLGGYNMPREGQSYYGSGDKGPDPNTKLADALNEVFGDERLFQLKTNVLFTAVERIPIPSIDDSLKFKYRPTLFSNMLGNGLEGQNYKIKEVVQASGSAPFYFPPFPIKDTTGSKRLYIDGGVGINNPSVFLLGYSNMLGIDYDRIVLLSVGCGVGNVGFFNPYAPTTDKVGLIANVTDNVDYMKQMIDVASGSAQEAAAQQMQLLSDFNVRINDADFIHYRFSTLFASDKAEDTELDNSDQKFINYMREACYNEINKKEQQYKISSFIYNCDF